MLCTCLCTNCKAHNRSWDLWLTKYIFNWLEILQIWNKNYEISYLPSYVWPWICSPSSWNHSGSFTAHFFLNWGKYFFGDCHTTNHKNHNKILEYNSHLPSEYEHQAYLLFTGGTSTSYTGSSGASKTNNFLSPCKCENHNMGPPSRRLMLIYI